MISGLLNLPRSGVIENVENFVWQRVTAKPPSGHTRAVETPPPDQVLVNDDATEALVRILKRQQQDSKKKDASKGLGKRSLETVNQTDAIAQKKLVVSATLAGPKDTATRMSPAPSPAVAGTSVAGDTKRAYSQDELKSKTVKDLQDLLKARGIPITGKKEALMQRVIDFQRRQKIAAMGPQINLT